MGGARRHVACNVSGEVSETLERIFAGSMSRYLMLSIYLPSHKLCVVKELMMMMV